MAGRYLTEYKGLTYNYFQDGYVQLEVFVGERNILALSGSVAPTSVRGIIDRCAKEHLSPEVFTEGKRLRLLRPK